MPYDHNSIEKKWQKYWSENKTFKTLNSTDKPKKYILDMFPYPSGAGLHVGHPKGYTATDIVSRYYYANGYNVLHTMGFDAFGLPAENYAIKTGTHPAITTAANIGVFTEQLQSLGFSYDWDRMVDTTNPEYYKWTQWIFLELFKKGLAYEQDLPINYCPSCKTGLANEEVTALNTCDRCGTRVEKRALRQWVLKITEYADRLIDDLEGLDWPEGVKEMQKNWIGKSEGCEFEMRKSDDADKFISVYTTRVDTVYGMTYAVLAPDHPRVYDFITDDQSLDCEAYITESASRSDQDRTNEGKEKTGVFTGSYVINPFNGESVPLWIADYVLGHYGTGAVMAVPAHDERDFAFAKKYNLPIKQVIATYNKLTGESTPKEGFPTRTKYCTTSIIQHPTEEKFLIENFSNGEVCLLGGGIDGEENPLEGALREIQEESGLADIKRISQVGIMVGHGFKLRKNTNCKDPDYIFFVELNSLDGFQETLKEDDVEYTNVWWTKEEILSSNILKSHHKRMFEMFLDGEKAMPQDGILMNSGKYDLISSSEARQAFSEKAKTEGFGHKKVNYKLRDWLFSRQRYWGEPIPLIHLAIEDVKKLPHITNISEVTDMNIAYILKREPREGENTAGVLCHGKVRELIIGGKIFSQIYDGITGKLIIDSRLPLTLPAVEKYEPAGDGQSPLATVPDWFNVKLAENLNGKRETNTMPQWGGSCWYYLRYMDNTNPDALASPDALDYWKNVDEYVGGAEHAVLHLLYARFWHKVLYDIGVVPTVEPFQKLTNVGMILAYAYERADGGLVAVDLVEEKDGKFIETATGKEVKQVVAKMSKSLKNVVNPNDIVVEYGADTLRLYEMSMSAFTDTAPWNPDAIIGVRRFLDKAYSMVIEGKNKAKDDMKAMKLLHKTIKKVGEDIVGYKFNTAIAALQILLNEGLPQDAEFAEEWKEKLAILLHPFAPHMAEELYASLGKTDSIYRVTWPEYDEFMLVDDEVTIAIQIAGKLRGTLTFLNGVAQEEVSIAAMEDPNIAKWLEGKEIIKEIFIPNKMLSIVVKG